MNYGYNLFSAREITKDRDSLIATMKWSAAVRLITAALHPSGQQHFRLHDARKAYERELCGHRKIVRSQRVQRGGGQLEKQFTYQNPAFVKEALVS